MKLVAGTCELSARIRIYDAATGHRINDVVRLVSSVEKGRAHYAVLEPGTLHERVVYPARIVVHPEDGVAIVIPSEY